MRSSNLYLSVQKLSSSMLVGAACLLFIFPFWVQAASPRVKVTASQGGISGMKFCACGGNITFTATVENCPSGSNFTYTWSGDVTGSGASVTKSFTSLGPNKTATVTVSGDASVSDTLTFEILGQGSEPTSVIDVNYTFAAYGTPPAWGLTQPGDIVADITAYCATDNTWKCKVTQADEEIKQSVRLLPGVVEVTDALVASSTSCATLNTMKTSLNSVANQGADSGYYMISAVQAHENLHSDEAKRLSSQNFQTLKTSLEAITIPFADATSDADAKAQIKAKTEYTTAINKCETDDAAAWNKSAITKHNPITVFNNAEHGVVDPMITTINNRRTALNCP